MVPASRNLVIPVNPVALTMSLVGTSRHDILMVVMDGVPQVPLRDFRIDDAVIHLDL